MNNYQEMSKEELIKRIKELEDENTILKSRQEELEGLLTEYSTIMKRQFEVFDDFVKDVGTRRMIDPLTRVYSKEHLLKLITYYHQKAFEEGFGYSIIMVTLKNLDNFEQIEKEHTLLSVGKLLKELVRVPLDSVGRYSESQFIVLLTEVNRENSNKVLGRIETSLRNYNIPCELRMVTYPDDSTNLEELFRKINS